MFLTLWATPRLAEIYERSRPFHEAMAAHRLRPAP